MAEQLTIGDVTSILREKEQPVVSTSELAERTGYSRQHVDNFLKQHSAERISSVDVGGSKGWYLRENPHPAQIIEDEIEGLKIIKIAEPDCNKCNSTISEGEEIVALFERIGQEWEVLDAICSSHNVTRERAIEAVGYESYAREAEDVVEFAVCRGLSERRETDVYEKTVITEPILLQYLPRTESPPRGELRAPSLCPQT